MEVKRPPTKEVMVCSLGAFRGEKGGGKGASENNKKKFFTTDLAKKEKKETGQGKPRGIADHSKFIKACRNENGKPTERGK